MKQIRIIILLIATSLLLCACPDKDENGHRYITFVNKSGEKIGYQISFDKALNIYRDTVFLCNMTSDNFIDNDFSFFLECPLGVDSWERDLSDLYYIQFLVLDGGKFSQYSSEPCDTIRKYVPILHTYRLTLKDLQRMNWTLTYPPSPNMSAIKMYPSYGK
jgi:hypothetical protein